MTGRELSLSEINAREHGCDGIPILDCEVNCGDYVKFSTAYSEGTGTVLEIDHGAMYPVKIQYTASNGESIINTFEVSEFITLTILH